MILNSLDQRRAGQSNDPEGRRSEDRRPCPLPESDPNRSRTLGCDFVKHKGRKQANSSVRDTFRHLSVRVAFRNLGIGQSVNSASRPTEPALAVETNKIFPWKADGLNVAGPNDPVLADVPHNLLERFCHIAHVSICHYLIITNDVLQHCR